MFLVSDSSRSQSPPSSDASDKSSLEVKDETVVSKDKSNQPKTRCKSGCITCRIRRVKCDEAKPNCVRCTSTGRKCDGYQAPTSKRVKGTSNAYRRGRAHVNDQRVHTIPEIMPSYNQPIGFQLPHRLQHQQGYYPIAANPVSHPMVPLIPYQYPPLQHQQYQPPQHSEIVPNAPSFHGSTPELRGLQYFRTRTAVALSGYFDSDFWTSLVLQASYDEPIVRHAVLAISSLHEGFEVGGELRPGNTQNAPHQEYALQQYNHAVNEMVQRLSTKSTRLSEVTLISCLLFLFVELMQNNYTTATVHLKNGLRILSSICSEIKSGSRMYPSFQIPHIKDNLSKLFARVLIQSVFLGVEYFELHSLPDVSVPDSSLPFVSITIARDALDGQFLSLFPFLVAASTSQREQPENGSELSLQQARHSVSLQHWHTTFLNFIAQRRHTFTSKETTGVTLLQLHYICLTIILSTALIASETALEAFTPSFARILALAEGLIGTSPGPLPPNVNHNTTSTRNQPTTTLPNFSFDIGVIPTLFYTALKCRASSLRWRAIALLRRAPHREGIWSAAMAASMAQKIVEIEEEELRSPIKVGSMPMSRDASATSTVLYTSVSTPRDAYAANGHSPIDIAAEDARHADASYARMSGPRHSHKTSLGKIKIKFRNKDVNERALRLCVSGLEKGKDGMGGAWDEIVTW